MLTVMNKIVRSHPTTEVVGFPAHDRKTYGMGNMKNNMFITGIKEQLEIEENDFCTLIDYFLTNTNLRDKDDPRIKLVEDIKKLEIGEGYNGTPNLVKGLNKKFKKSC